MPRLHIASLLLAATAAASARTNVTGPFTSLTGTSSGCPLDGPASCHGSDDSSNSCCYETPGGLLLQTQFWDTSPETGPTNSWTIHGLWPDNCDGTYIENCDPSRAYTDIAGLLQSQGASDTLDYMQTYWVNINGDNEEFWEHEWETHGTCYNTLLPSCLPDDSPEGAEAVSFFQTVVALFQTLPTYDWLAVGHITPNAHNTYTLAQITDALTAAAGVTPALSCEGKRLDSISWYFNLKGSLLDGQFVPVDAPEKGNCPSKGIEYLPKKKKGDMTGSAQEILA